MRIYYKATSADMPVEASLIVRSPEQVASVPSVYISGGKSRKGAGTSLPAEAAVGDYVPTNPEARMRRVSPIEKCGSPITLLARFLRPP